MTTTIPAFADITTLDDLEPLIAEADTAYYAAIGTGVDDSGLADTAYYGRLADRARTLLGLYRRAAALADSESLLERGMDIAVEFWRREVEACETTVAALRRRVA